MSRTAAYLAALASTAVPDLDPVSVRAVRPGGAARYDVGFVVDAAQRPWTVRVPRTAADGERQDAVVTLLDSLAARVPFSVPTPRGFVAVPHGRAMVYPSLAGRPLLLAHVPPGPGLAADLGRAIGALHNVERQVFDAAGVEAYDADSYREHHLAQLDRAAGTGHVPAALLHRWERALEDPSLWRFEPAPIHGRLTGRAVLASFGSEEDASTGQVAAITGWEEAKVADPADDLAAVLDECQPETADTVLEAYAHSRRDRLDPHLRRRALLAGELHLLADLLAAVATGARELVRLRVSVLRQLQEHTRDDDRLFPSPSAASSPPRPASAQEPFPGSTVPVEADLPANGWKRPGAGATAASSITQEIPSSELAKAWNTASADPPARATGQHDSPGSSRAPGGSHVADGSHVAGGSPPFGHRHASGGSSASGHGEPAGDEGSPGRG